MLLRSLLLLALALLPLATAAAHAQGLGLGTPDSPVTDWPTADPVALGLDTTGLAEHARLCEVSGATACLVAYKGHIVQEWTPADRTMPFHSLASATKSVAALLTGMLIADGQIGSVDDRVATYLPEWQAGADSAVTIRHLLTMTSGLPASFSPEIGPGVVAEYNTTPYLVGLGLSRSPGERWAYSNESAQMLSPILERAAGMPLAAYARERLFMPLGMRHTYLRMDDYGHTWTAGGAETSHREFARLGQLVLNEGRWNGEQIIPADWIAALNTPTPANKGYGYLWWRLRDGAALVAAGSLDRILSVLPEQDLVAVRLQEGVLPRDENQPTYFNDRGRMHGDALDILQRVVPPADAPSSSLDRSGVDAFWRVCDALAAGGDAPETAWAAYFTTPGLAALLEREPRRRATLTDAIPLACDPARAAEADSMARAGGYAGDWLLPHLRRVVAQRAQTTAFLADLDLSATRADARRRVQAYLPAGLTEAHEPPPVSVTHFLAGGRGYAERIVIDVLDLMEMHDPAAFLAHEFHHAYRAHLAPHLTTDFGDVPDRIAPLAHLLVRLEEEGIADRLDKADVPTLTDDQLTRRYPAESVRSFFADYQRHIAEVPQWLPRLEAALIAAATDAPEAEAVVRDLKADTPFNGRPAGAFMARLVEEQLGRQRLAATVGRPLAFLMAYQEAATRSGGPALSAAGVRAVQALDQRYAAAE